MTGTRFGTITTFRRRSVRRQYIRVRRTRTYVIIAALRVPYPLGERKTRLGRACIVVLSSETIVLSRKRFGRKYRRSEI